MANEPAILATGLSKQYGSVRVLDGLDLRVESGEIFALLGPNGAGKTTTVRALATLLRPDAGTARVAGFDVVADQAAVRRRISLTGQYAALDDLQTGSENLRMIGQLTGRSRKAAADRARELLARFDLVDAGNRTVTTYSGGMRRRLDLAAGLLGDPEIIFLDEPTTGLDLRSRQAMWEVITRLAETGVTVFLTTQYLEEADRLADRIAVIDGGRVVASGTPTELKEHVAGTRLEITFSDFTAFTDGVRLLGDRILQSDRAALAISIATSPDANEIRDLLDEIDPFRQGISHFALQSATLDDVFLALTGHHAIAETEEALHV